jgi:hypothetical protein
MRAVLTILIPLLLPSLVYWLYLKMRQRQGLPFHDIPWIWPIGAGVVLALAALAITWYADSEPTTGRYVPPQVVDGEVVPGHFVPAEEGAQ